MMDINRAQKRKRRRMISSSKTLGLTAVWMAVALVTTSNCVRALSTANMLSRTSTVNPLWQPMSTPTITSTRFSLQPFLGSTKSFPTHSRHTTALTTSVAPLDDDSPPKGVLASAVAKFESRPGTYLMIPVIAGFVGWLTNYLAVQMIFYPVQFKGIPIWRRPEIPLGLLGWQGIVPCKTATMSRALVDMVETQLLTVPAAFARLNPTQVAKHLAGAVPQLGEAVIQDLPGATQYVGPWQSIFGVKWCSGFVKFCNVQVLRGVVKDLIKNSERIFSLENCVVDQMILDRAKLGQLFQKVGRVELDFLTNSGLWFGFLLGLIQMAVALVWENPWALSIGGTIVGLATNWLALKWIFEPVYPTKIGPFVVQGMFLTRQKEVAAEFSKFFARKIVTSEQIWNSVLTDSTTRPALTQVLGGHVKKLLSLVSLGLFKGLPSATTISKVTESTIANLPNHLTNGLHKYVDRALGLETTLRTQMEAMSPAKFERVLHPIFEEDELTLIIAGGVLGFIAGLIQQGLETGQIKIPPLPPWMQNILGKVKQACNDSLTCVQKSISQIFRKITRMNGTGDGTYDLDNGDGVSGE